MTGSGSWEAGSPPVRVLSDDEGSGESYLGQFIPLHYHHNMLKDANRMGAFKAAIDHAVFAGAKVLELGGGTGALSCLAASRADKVWCVEFNPDLVAESRRLLALNRDGRKVEVVHADAFEYLPPEPVDVVICEMVHTAMLREKQVEMIESFKSRYRGRYGAALPTLIPEAVVMAVQPLQQNYDFFGFHAPIIQFQRGRQAPDDTVELAPPQTYSLLDFTASTGPDIAWEGTFALERDGTVNALRFITKNVLAVVPERSATIDWFIDHLVLPLERPVACRAGDALDVSFRYRAGGPIRALERSLVATRRE